MTTPIDIIAVGLLRERQRAGLSITEVARRAGIAKSTLSQLEAGNGNPSLETLWALCVALNIPFARLMEPEVKRLQVIRRGEGMVVSAEMADYQAALLASCPPGGRRDLYLITSQPGAPRASKPHPPGSVEHIIIARGRALVGPSDEPVELHPGDYICYPADEPHVFEALEADTMAVQLSEQN
ncbi:helix-turn-helix domain-containing protein [Pantoea sp. NPDC088449]|uniref:Transcriptional regulator, XRE family with cupin sensor n=1 Tax=Candidatus Pantoea floridensis TaxID=1938870 RepID=A0A286DPP0_9GAMM|nr:XRE family transcriptional regulator [Pantoea floridensis]PIF15010.1 XRE family transcriptional regulator [Enterobacteriaceae bacterium JKS000233]SOD60667.1 transcriptional regulator, XRE family with cupin sensor [Pantoea floridensis]